MPSVDNRVVEMRFDNKDFQSGVSESISSLDKLKRSLKLKDSADGFDEIGRAAESVTQKFSALGTIGDQILRNIANEVYNLKNQFVDLVKSMSVDQITAGWNKYGEKTSSVQTILNATGLSLEEVNTQLDRLMTYSDETSFGFTDMTAALQTMTASGGKLENLIPMLMGIGNATAYAGKSAGEFSRVVYNLNQAYGLGYLGTMDWKSVQMAGVASKQLKQALLDSARALGTGNYTMDQFQTALTKKAFTTEVMEDAFGKFAKVTLEAEKLMDAEQVDNYTEAYAALKDQFLGTGDAYDELAFKAAKAAQEAKTFKEAIDATKDAVSTGWMTTFEQIFGNYEEAKENWSWLAEELWEVFASGAQGRNEMLAAWHENGYEKLWDSIKNIWYGLRSFGGRIKNAWLQIFPSLDSQKLLEITDKFYNFSVRFRQALDPAFEVVDKITTTFERNGKLFTTIFGVGDVEIAQENLDEANGVISTGIDLVDRYLRTLEKIDELEAKVWQGKYGVGQTRKEQLEEEGFAYELVQNQVNETAGCYARLEVDEEALAQAQGILNGEIQRSVTPTEDAAEATEELAQASKKSRNWISDLRDVLHGFKSALDLVVDAGKAVAKVVLVPAWNFLVEVFKKFLAIIAPVSRAFSEFVEKVKETHAIENGLKALGQWFSSLYDNLKEKENFKKFLGYLQEFKTWISGIKDKALDKVTGFFDKLAEMDIQLPDTSEVAEWVNTAFGWIDGVIEKIKEAEGWWPKIKAFFEGLDFSSVTEFAKSAANGVSTFFQTLFADKDLEETSSGWIDQLLSGIKKKLSEVDWSEILDIALKGLGGAMIFKLVNSISNFVGAGADVLDKFKTRISLFLKGITKVANATAILELAVAIGVLAGAMWVLSKVPSDRLPQIAVDLSAVILAFSVLSKVLFNSKLFNGIKSGVTNKLNIKVFSTIGSILIGLGVLIGAWAIFAKTLNKIKSEGGKVWTGVGVIAALLGMMAVFAVLVKVLGTVGNKSSYKILHGDSFGTDMLKMAGSFAIMALAINLMLPAIASLTGLASLNPDALWTSIITIGVIFGAFAIVVVAAKKASQSGIVKVGAAFLLLAIAFNLLVPVITALQLLANKKLASFIAVMVSILTLLGAFALVIKVLGQLKSNGAKKGSEAIVAIGVALLAIAGTMRIIKGIQWADISTGIFVIAGVIAVLVALGALAGADKFSFIARGMLAVGGALLLFGAGMALVGSGAKAFAKAFDILKDNSGDAVRIGKDLAAGVGSFFTELNNSLGPIIAVVTKIVGAVIFALLLKKGDIVATGGEIISAFGDKIKTSIGEHKWPLITAFAGLIGAILTYFNLDIDRIVDTLVAGVALILFGVANGIANNRGEILAAVGALVDSGILLIEEVLNQLYGKYKELGGGTFIDWYYDSEQEKWVAFRRETKGQIGQWIEDSISETTEDLDRLNKEYGEPLQDKVTNNIKGIMSGVKNTIKENAESVGEEAEDAIKSVDMDAIIARNWERNHPTEPLPIRLSEYVDVDSVTEVLDSSDWVQNLVSLVGKDVENADWDLIGASVPEGLREGIERASGSVIDSGTDMIDLLKAYVTDKLEINSPSHVAQEWGSSVDEGFGLGMTRNTRYIRSSINRIIDNVKLGFDDLYERMKKIGLDAIQGFANGMNDYLSIVEITSEKVGKVAIRGLKKSIDSNSPSKEFGKLGKYSAQGYANELANNAYLAEDAATSFGEDTLSAFNSVISRIYDAINGDFDMNPVIRPVLDLSEIQNGQGRIASFLGTGSLSMSPNMQYSMIHANNVMASVNADGLVTEVRALREEVRQLKAEQSRTDISSAVRSIRNEVGDFKESLGRMRVVLDDGTLVGHIDSALGQRTRLARRGV